MKTKDIVYMGLFAAIAAAANIFTIQVFPPYFVISFVLIISFLIGVRFGPVYSFLVCFLGDLLGCIIHPFGPYNILIGVSNGLIGFIFGFLKNKKTTIWNTCLLFLIVTLFITSGLNTFALWLVYGLGKKTFWVYLSARLPYQILNSIFNCLLAVLLGGKYAKALQQNRSSLGS